MILQEDKLDVKTSQKFKSRQMSIAEEYVSKMIWHTILQYKYKIRTSLQELISNAIDAQVDAGNKDKPLKIQLPTRLEPTFKLRDFGTGMTPDVIDAIYCNMGASGSSHTNDKKGGFGIGGKSPLGFTDQYKIRTIVDGTEWTYLVYKNADNGISVDLLAEQSTDEPNGTEIQIGAKPDQIGKFKEGACRATMFWEVQPEFNFPAEERYTANNGKKLSENVTLYSKQDLSNLFGVNSGWGGNSTVLVLIDGIPYELDSDMIRKVKPLNQAHDYLKSDSVLVLSVKVGDVKPLQTREALEEHELTWQGLEKVGQEALEAIEKDIKALTNKPTLMKTVEAYRELSELYRHRPAVEFKEFKINQFGISWKDDLESLELVEYTHRSKRSIYSRNEKARREVSRETILNLDKLNKIYLDDTDESMVMKSRRLKYEIEADKGDIYLIGENTSPELLKLLTEHLELKALSSLPLPPKKAKNTVTRAKKVLGEGKVDVHILCRYDATRDARTINLKENEAKFIYADYSSHDHRMLDLGWIRLMKRRGFSPCLVAKKYQKDVEANKNFTAFSEWVKTAELTENEVKSIILKRADKRSRYFHRKTFSVDVEEVRKLASVFTKSRDKELTRLAKNVMIQCGGVDLGELPSEMVKKVEEERADEIKRLRLAAKIFEKRATEKYPLIEEMGSHSWNKQNLLSYINKGV